MFRVTVDGRVLNYARGECIESTVCRCASTAVSVINKLERQTVLLTTRSSCCGEIFSSPEFGGGVA